VVVINKVKAVKNLSQTLGRIVKDMLKDVERDRKDIVKIITEATNSGSKRGGGTVEAVFDNNEFDFDVEEDMEEEKQNDVMNTTFESDVDCMNVEEEEELFLDA